ncbi:PTS sugar transporter subunit IIC [Lactobacillus mulieris]|jgi:phosphoeNolpyruvate-dependent sugar phosphotransferase system eiic, n-acetylgalactosamine specific|uniref:PTS mannose/fructose/sorbose/N-acetylgalactosamine transporter subunit IIC n=1 Tax=Lactobacillus mulieris TaxID=2508708 RepID=UPI0001C04B47|nr:PTS sugar transporter subunit IIC [Lactobacillus mulieris]KAA9367040.1 PTS sugar transporter subunit IIC [Lactobacillus jensenii]MCF1847902.1 PTS sugar transporter subunit IIC [Lactobacillus mulieris]MCW8073701.1 PTS sugar transporter subunit IIC [Lactobacillus mulieris]MCW8105905.1 PTS sugar transporter subunit IIC [Lactobacillus mulieris]MDK6269282.1 PTS sugar transporter subunit IIC [Lactobacillus mulieris]
MIAWWQIILLTALAFWMILDQLTLVTINSPLLIGMISGIIMGDIKTGLVVGSTLQLMVLGVSTYGGASMPDFMTGAIVGTVYAVLTNKGTQFAIGLAVPVGLLMVQLDVLARFFNTIFQHKMDQAIKNNNTKVASRNAYLGFLSWGLSRAIPVFILLVIGNDIVKTILRVVPVWLTNGLKVSGGILPVVGIAILLRYLPTKKFISYLIIGFLAAAYLKMPMLGVALLGAALAILNYKRENTPTMQTNTTSYENAEGEYED